MDENPDDQSKYRFLCLCVAEEKVAAAYYEVQTSRICVLSQMPEPGSAFEVSQQILRQVEPTVTIIPSSATANFVDAVRCYTDQEEISSRTPKAISDQIDCERPECQDMDDSVTPDKTLTPRSGSTATPAGIQFPGTPVTALGTETPTSGPVSGEKQTPRKRLKRQQMLHRVSENVVSLAAKFFSVAHAKNAILNYDGFAMPADANRATRQSFLAGCIDFEETVTIRALAGLITYLTRSAINQLVTMTGSLTVTSFRLADAVRISDASLRSLAIVYTNLIPRHEQVAVSRKPALSVLSLFLTNCRTQTARKKLRQMLIQPIRHQKELNERLDFAEYFIQPEREDLMSVDQSELRQRLFRVKSLNSVFRQMRCKLVPLSDWRTFVYSFNAAVLAMESMKKCGEPKAMSDRAAELLTPQILTLSQQIEMVISLTPANSEYEPLNSSFCIKENVFHELDERRQMLAQINDLLKEATFREVDEWTKWGMGVPLFSISFMYGPGFLMALSLHTSDLREVLDVLSQRSADQIFNARTMTGTHVYFKTTHLKHFDLTYGDKIQEIASMQTKIQHDMQVFVLDHADTITDMVDHCASVEALLAFADMAKQEGWSRPVFNKDRMEITDGKHPLYQKLTGVESFQANSLISPSHGRKVKIVTGPNASGKTVFLKQVGIITHLALCGSYVPAEAALIPIVDSIFTCLKHNYSITMEASTFFSDLKAMTTMANQATGKSLVLLDEFGKGTRPQDGIALLAGAIQYFVTRDTPHLLIASHFHCLKDILREEERSIQYLRFRADTDSSGIFQPSYVIEEGKSSSSLASSVYVKVELDKLVADRANQVFQLLKGRQPLDPQYTAEHRQIIAMIREIIALFHATNCGSKVAVEDMLDKIKNIPLNH